MIDLSSARTASDSVMYMVHHVFLPSKLPQSDDFLLRHERVFVDTVIDALWMFKDAVESGQRNVIESIAVMIGNLRTLQDDSGAIDEGRLETALQEMSERCNY